MLIHDVVAGCWKIEEDIRGRMFPYRCGLYLKELAGLQKTKKNLSALSHHGGNVSHEIGVGGDEKAERQSLHLRTACPQKTGKKKGLLG
jgi:hypothetical protein